MPVTGPYSLETFSWLAVGVGLHLLSLAFAGTVDRATLTGMTDDQETHSEAEPQVRELAAIPAVEVITRSAVMLMSALVFGPLGWTVGADRKNPRADTS